MSETPEFELREYRAGDEHAILETFNRCFAAVDPNFVPRTLEEWRWQYADNPSGWRIWLALAPDGQVISQYAGIGQRMWVAGRPMNFSQAVDSMTDPAYRRGLKKPGFFVLTGYPYAENYGGRGAGKDVIMWGLPVPPAWRIGKRYLNYELIRNQHKLVLDLERWVRPSNTVQVQPIAAFDDSIDALSERSRDQRGAVAIRDGAQMRWRYDQRPGFTYERALAKNAAGDVAGFAVFRDGAFDLEHDGLLVDHLTDVGDDATLLALVDWAVERARAAGRERLVAMLPDTAPEFLTLQHHGFRVRATRYLTVGRSYARRYDMRWAYENWYYTLGDTDLV